MHRFTICKLRIKSSTTHLRSDGWSVARLAPAAAPRADASTLPVFVAGGGLRGRHTVMRQKERTLLLWLVLIAMFAGPIPRFPTKDMDRAWRRLSRMQKARRSAACSLSPTRTAPIESCYGCCAKMAAATNQPYRAHCGDCVGPIGRNSHSLKPAGRIDTTFWLSLIPVLLIGFCLLFCPQPSRDWAVASRRRDRYRPSANRSAAASQLGKTVV